jgi:hypothetical protein
LIAIRYARRCRVRHRLPSAGGHQLLDGLRLLPVQVDDLFGDDFAGDLNDRAQELVDVARPGDRSALLDQWRCMAVWSGRQGNSAQLIEGKYVSCIDQRTSGDAVAVVCGVPVGDVGQMMVQDGMAVVPFELSKAYLGDQIQAKSSARGIWAGTVENPWEYRAKLKTFQIAR